MPATFTNFMKNKKALGLMVGAFPMAYFMDSMSTILGGSTLHPPPAKSYRHGFIFLVRGFASLHFTKKS